MMIAGIWQDVDEDDVMFWQDVDLARRGSGKTWMTQDSTATTWIRQDVDDDDGDSARRGFGKT